MPACCTKVIAASGTVTACECTAPGFCERHGCKKPNHFYMLCKTRPEYFDKWENGEGPGQTKAANPLPLGTWLAGTIKAVTLGKITPCTSCTSRMSKLNKLGAKIAGLFHARK